MRINMLRAHLAELGFVAARGRTLSIVVSIGNGAAFRDGRQRAAMTSRLPEWRPVERQTF